MIVVFKMKEFDYVNFTMLW